MHVMGLAGLSMDLIKDFVDKTNIGIDHFNFKEKKDDFETILDAIKKIIVLSLEWICMNLCIQSARN